MDQTDEEKRFAKAKRAAKSVMNKEEKLRKYERVELKLSDDEIQIRHAKRFCGKALSDIFHAVAYQASVPFLEDYHPNSVATHLDALFGDLKKLTPENGWPKREWLDQINDVLRSSINGGLDAFGVTEEKSCITDDQLYMLVRLADPISLESKGLYWRTYCRSKRPEIPTYTGPERRVSTAPDRRKTVIHPKVYTPEP